jgi:hypothetical protein
MIGRVRMTAGVMSTPDRVFVDGAQVPGRGQHYPLASNKEAILPSRCQLELYRKRGDSETRAVAASISLKRVSSYSLAARSQENHHF